MPSYKKQLVQPAWGLFMRDPEKLVASIRAHNPVAAIKKFKEYGHTGEFVKKLDNGSEPDDSGRR